MEDIEKQLPKLEAEKKQLEENLHNLPHEDIIKSSARIAAIISEIDLCEMRWLELQEKAS